MIEMIYLPRSAFSLWNTVSGALLRAGHELLFDFDKGNPKPWAYYPGVFGGVLANNAPGMGAVVYFIGSAVDIVFRKGPDASDIGWFVDGIAQADISAFAASEFWEHLRIGELLENVVHSIRMVNKPSATDPDNDGVMGIGEVKVTGDPPRAAPFASELSAAVWVLAYTIRDAHGHDSAHLVYLPMAFYEYDDASYFAETYGRRLEPLIDGVIRQVSISRTLKAPGPPGEAPGPLSDVNAGMYVGYIVPGVGGEYAHTLATWSEGYTIPEWDNHKRAPRWTDEEVTGFFALMVSAESEGFPANPCDRRGVPITGIAKAYQKFRA